MQWVCGAWAPQPVPLPCHLLLQLCLPCGAGGTGLLTETLREYNLRDSSESPGRVPASLVAMKVSHQNHRGLSFLVCKTGTKFNVCT